MTGRIRTLNKHLKGHDKELFCQQNGERIDIMRYAHRTQRYEFDGKCLIHVQRVPQWVLSLTDNWYATGIPREWGVEPVIKKLKSMDAWTRTRIVEEAEDLYEEANNQIARNRRSEIESFASDYRSDFKKATEDINLANISKRSIFEKQGVK